MHPGVNAATSGSNITTGLFGLDAALVYAALRKSGREIYLVYAVINNYATIFYSMGGLMGITK
jgi:hypothetical protein